MVLEWLHLLPCICDYGSRRQRTAAEPARTGANEGGGALQPGDTGIARQASGCLRMNQTDQGGRQLDSVGCLSRKKAPHEHHPRHFARSV